MLLPQHHPVTCMILSHYHQKVKHQGRHITHGVIRDAGFHIENGRQVIRKLIKECILCRKLRAPLLQQKMGSLPLDRLEECPPFTNTGIDVFGPFFVHDGKSTRRTRATKKTWALLCTCLVSRAIHIEMLVSRHLRF